MTSEQRDARNIISQWERREVELRQELAVLEITLRVIRSVANFKEGETGDTWRQQ